MVTTQTVDVTLTPEGTVEIGVPPSGPGTHVFPVFGGLVGVDVTSPDRTPFTSVSDVSRAAWWLAAVYGEAAASAASALVPHPEDDGPQGEQPEGSDMAEDLPAASVNVALERGHLWDPLVRYGIGSWIQRWWPSSDTAPGVKLDEILMDLEVGALAWALEFVLGGTSVAATLLEGHVEDVLDNLDNTSPDNALLGPVLRALIESVPVSDELHGILREHESRIDQVTAGAAALTDGAIEQWYAEQVPELDPWAVGSTHDWDESGADPFVARGMPSTGKVEPKEFVVDVEQVPARSVSWAASAVSATIRALPGALEVQVAVRAGDVPTDLPLYARCYLNAEAVPTVVLELTRTSGRYLGSSQINDRDLPSNFFVDVFTPSLMTRPDPVRAASVRAAVMPIFDGLAEASRVAQLDDEPVQELGPRAPWRGLVAGAGVRG